ncbi:MAG TPA: DNA polymerase III subunit delta [Flavipsychrobacter sp.]|nr:DNA polymerase III subunit delta [Flavipsychrobacter sp.]
MSDIKKLFQSIKDKKFAPFYIVDGEEPFYIDVITEYFEKNILAESEKDFNLITLYGKDVEWTDVVNACRRFPMFAERQVVILKDAAQMKGLNELTSYLENPSPTTVLLIEHRFKKVDGRSKLTKLAKDRGFYFTSDKIKEEHLPGWIENYGRDSGFHIGEREAQLLAGYLGNDLQKVVNEIEKVRINVPGEKALTSELIQKYIGISREYNVFDFPVALTNKRKDKLYPMLAFFIGNAKAAPLPLLIGSFYSHFNTVYQAQAFAGREKELGASLRLFGDRLQDTLTAARNLQSPRIEMCINLLAEYSAKAVGVGNNASDRELLKEMVGKMELIIG